MPIVVSATRALETQASEQAQASDKVSALVELLRNRSDAEIRQRMYDSAPGSPWWTTCRAELELRNGQQVGEASLAMSRTSEKMRASMQHFEQLTDALQQAQQIWVKSNMSTGQALSDIARQWQLETHALKCFHHQYNPQNQTQQA